MNDFKLLLFLYFFIFLIRAYSTEVQLPDSLNEGYIQFVFDNLKGSSFFRVLMDEDENPYLPVKDILKDWLDFVPQNSDMSIDSRLIFYLNPGRREYWIDKTINTLKYPNGSIKVEKSLIVKYDNELWLRYDKLSEWLPVNVFWNLNDYSLWLYPQYKTRRRLELEREIQISLSKRQKELRDFVENTPAEIPDYGSFSMLTTVVQNYKHDRYSNIEESRLEGEINIDIPMGNLYIVHDRNYAKEQVGSTLDRLRYINLQIYKKNQISELKLGDVFVPKNFAVNSSMKLRGFGIKRLSNEQFDINIKFRHPLPSETEIDIYRNGIYLKTIRLEKQGFPDFSDVAIRPGDMVTWKIFYPDNEQRIIKIRVPLDNNMVIGKGKIDYGIYSGRYYKNYTNFFQMNSYDLRYGINTNQSLNLYHREGIDSNDKLIDINGVNFSFFPLSNVFLAIDGFKAHENKYYSINLNTILNPLTSFTFSMKNALEYKSYLNISGLMHYKREKKLRFHSFIKGGDFNLDVNYNEFQTVINTSYSKMLNFPIIGTTRFKYGHIFDSRDENMCLIGLNRKFSDYFLNLDFKLGDTKRSFSTRISGINSRINEILFDFNRDDNTESTTIYIEYMGNRFHWYKNKDLNRDTNNELFGFEIAPFNPSLSITGTFDPHDNNLEIGFKFTAFLGIGNNKSVVSYKNFRKAGIHGYIYQEINGKLEPLSKVRILCASNSVTSNKDGYYELYGLPVGTKLLVRLNGESYPSFLAPKKPLRIIKLRYGTIKRLDFVLIETGGIDGFVNISNKFNYDIQKLKIRIRDKNNLDNEDREYQLDNEGFFVFEGLRVNNPYIIEVLSPDGDILKTREIFINEEENWMSDIEINIE